MWVGATAGLAPSPCLASPRQAPAHPPPASLPAGTDILPPMGRARHPHGGTSGLLMDDRSPFSHTSPPLQASRRAQLQSLRPKLCPEAGKGSGQLASSAQLLRCGGPPAPSQQANRCAGAPRESRTRGPAAAIPNGAGRAQRAARGLLVRSPSLARRRSAPWMGQFRVHPASSLARGG